MDRITIIGDCWEEVSSVVAVWGICKEEETRKMSRKLNGTAMSNASLNTSQESTEQEIWEWWVDRRFFLRDSHIAIRFGSFDGLRVTWDKVGQCVRRYYGYGTGTLDNIDTIKCESYDFDWISSEIRNMTNEIKKLECEKWMPALEHKDLWRENRYCRLYDESCHYNNAIRSQQLVELTTWNSLMKVFGACRPWRIIWTPK